MSARFRQIATALLAVLGVQGWLIVMRGDWGRNEHVTLLVISIVAASVPWLSPLLWKLLRHFGRPTPVMKWITAALVSIAGAIILSWYDIHCGRDLFPTMHDELQFLVQTRMLVSGRLWLPGHPLADFFDTFYVLIQPKYAAQSFPGTAIFFAPALLLKIAVWKWAIGLASITVGLFYLVVTELIDGLAGLLAAALLLALSLFRYLSTLILAQIPLTLLGLATILAYLRWRKTRGQGWAIVLGCLAGLMLITRPADSLIFALPVGVAMLIDAIRRPKGVVTTLALGILGAAPWISIQLVFDYGVTGHWLTTPFTYYNQRDQPGLSYGLYPSTTDRNPLTKIPEKRGYYIGGVAWRLDHHRPGLYWHAFTTERLPVTLAADLPQPMLAALLPMGLLCLCRRRAWLLGLGVPLFFLVYIPYPLFITHYTIIAAPAEIFGVLLGVTAMARAWPRARANVWMGAIVFTAGLLVTRQVESQPLLNVLVLKNSVIRQADEWTEKLAQPGHPAVLLFKRNPQLAPDVEPVYNTDTAWIDDAPVIRAHDLGPENPQIFQYYATHGPDRAFYRFDEERPFDKPEFLGMASELARTSDGH
jgi:hypothetical protein